MTERPRVLDRTEPDLTVPRRRETMAALDAVLRLRLWDVFDAAKAICDADTPERWVNLYRAVAAIPESQHGR